MGDWFQDTPWIRKSADAQVLYIKWQRTIHAVSPPHPWIPSHGWKILYIWPICIFIEKNPPISGPGSSNRVVKGSTTITVSLWEHVPARSSHTHVVPTLALGVRVYWPLEEAEVRKGLTLVRVSHSE